MARTPTPTAEPAAPKKATPQRARRQARAGDATGRRDEELRAQAAEELKRRQGEMAMAAEREAEQRDQIVDLSGEAPLPEAITGDELEDEFANLTDEELFELVTSSPEDEEDNVPRGLLRSLAHRMMVRKRQAEADVVDAGVIIADEATAIIRVNEDLDNVTIGAGNHYSFEMGVRYRVPLHVALHLEEKGYVWH